jgi:site-specific DNA recombinase
MEITIDSQFWMGYIHRVNGFGVVAAAGEKAQEAASRPKVAVYARVSTEEQAEEGYSIDEQIRECRQYAERQGWEIAEIYKDEGFSGTNARRESFQRLLKDAAAGKFDGIVTHKIDRAYRNAEGMLRTFSDWQRMGVFFASANEQIDFTTPWGKLILGVLSLLAEMFVDNLRQETKKGKRGRFHSGLHNGHIPWGYCDGHCSHCKDVNGDGYCPRVGLPDLNGGKEAVPHPVDSHAFRVAHAAYLSGNYSDVEIAELLNQFKYLLPDGGEVQVRSRGKPGMSPAPFTKEMVRDLLKSPFYTGKIPYYGSEYDGEQVKKNTAPQDVADGKHVGLITEDEFARALEIRELKGTAPQGKGRSEGDTTRSKSAPRQASRVYVLGSLLDCGECGNPMRSQAGGKNSRRHVCSTRLTRRGVCSQSSVSADALESELSEKMGEITLPEAWQEAVVGYMVKAGGMEAIHALRQELDAHWETVEKLYKRGELGRNAYLKERRAYQKGLEDLGEGSNIERDLQKAKDLMVDFASLWRLLTPLERKDIAQSLLRVGVVDNKHVARWEWYPPFNPLFASA